MLKTIQDVINWHKVQVDHGGSCGDGSFDVRVRAAENAPHIVAAEILQKFHDYGMNFSKPRELLNKVIQWADDRNIISGATSQAQMLKLTEEVGELAHAIGRGKREQIADAIGDCVVVLTILAAQNDLDIEACLEHAYEQIKNRKGKMKDGIWVKEE